MNQWQPSRKVQMRLGIVASMAFAIGACGDGAGSSNTVAHIDGDLPPAATDAELESIIGFELAAIEDAVARKRYASAVACVKARGFETDDIDYPNEPPGIAESDVQFSPLLINLAATREALASGNEWNRGKAVTLANPSLTDATSKCAAESEREISNPLVELDRWIQGSLRETAQAMRSDERNGQIEDGYQECLMEIGFTQDELAVRYNSQQSALDGIYDEWYHGRASKTEVLARLQEFESQLKLSEEPFESCRRSYEFAIRHLQNEYERSWLDEHGDALRERGPAVREALNELLSDTETNR